MPSSSQASVRPVLFLIKAIDKRDTHTSSLFDMPVHVGQSVRKDGTVVAAHTRIAKVKAKEGPKPEHHAEMGDLFGDAPAMLEKPTEAKPKPDIARMREVRDMLRDFVAAYEREGKPVGAERLAKLAELDAAIGDAAPAAKVEKTEEAPIPDDWSETRKAAARLYREYNRDRVEISGSKAMRAQFIKRLRAQAAKTSEDDDQAVFYLSALETKLDLGNVETGRGTLKFAVAQKPDAAQGPAQVAQDVADKPKFDNQGRDLEAMKRAKDEEAARTKISNAAATEKHARDVAKVPLAEWTDVNDVHVLRCGNSRFVAVPRNGKETGKQFDIIDLQANERGPTLDRSEVRSWLWSSAKAEADGDLPAPAADEPKEGDTKIEDGIEYRLQDGRWHRVTPEEKAEEKATGHTYGMTLRPPAIGAIPKGMYTHADHPAFRHGAITYDRPLTDDEVYSYELTPIVGIDEHARKIVEKMGKYAERYADNDKALRSFIDVNAHKLGVWSTDDKGALLERVKAMIGKPFVATHELSDGTPVRAHPEDAGVWIDKDGNELESEDDAIPKEEIRNAPAAVAGDDADRPGNEPVAHADAPAPAAETEEGGHAGRDAAAGTGSFGVEPGTSKGERRKLNAKAAAIVDRGGPFSDEDKAVLRQYSGNGGCGDSLNEFYTPVPVAQAMWQVMQRLGVSGDILEPSCGTGVFMHTAPAGVKVAGIEMDPTSAKIARALHGGAHEINNSSLERFAVQDDRRFDGVVGNPPFGLRGSLIADDKRNIKSAERYFTDTAIDKTKPGGIIALVLPSGVMDSSNGRSFRERVLRKAEFLGAMRMPNSAFEASHTDVTADVVFFRKRPDDVAGALGTVDQDTLKKLGVWDDEFLAGSYFTGRGAAHVMGTPGTAQRAFGEIYTVNGSMADVPEEIAGFVPETPAPSPAVTQILEALGDDEQAKERALGGTMTRPYERTAKLGDTKEVDGVQYILSGHPPRWHRVDEFVQGDAIYSGVALSVEIDRLLSGGDVDRPKLEADLREWVKANGLPSKHPDILLGAKADRTLFRLIGAVGPTGELSDAVMGKLRPAEKGSFETTMQVLAMDKGAVSVAEIAHETGMGSDEILDHLYADPQYALAPDGEWTTMDVYLTGNLWLRLDAANAMLDKGNLDEHSRGKLQAQIKALNEAIDPKLLEDVEVALNSAFVPTSILAAFLTERNKNSGNSWQEKLDPVDVTFDTGLYTMKGGSLWGDQKLILSLLNRKGVKEDDLPRVAELNAEFKDWLCQSQYREQVEDLYNRKFRGFKKREYSNTPIDVPGMVTDGLKDYQWSGLRWALDNGKGIIAADVGLGKTARALMLAKMMKVTGKASKPLIVVPKSVLGNWVAEVDKWFPGSRVLTIGGEFERLEDGTLKGRDDDADEKKRKWHDLTQNDYDFVICSEPAFEAVDLDPETKYNLNEADFWNQRGRHMENAGDKRTKKIREGWAQHRANQEFSKRTDAIYFNDLGVDAMIVDEAHHQKNLYAAKARFGESPKFLGGQGLSMRALDFNLKSRWLLSQNDGKNVYGLTATPTKNSPLEIYSMLSHVAPEAFEQIGIRNSKEFLDRFAQFEQTDTFISTSGAVESATITAGFKNMNELREIMSRWIDRKTADDVGLKLPERDDHLHMIDMDADQEREYVSLREQIKEVDKDSTGDAHIFSIMNRMNKAAIDLGLFDPDKYADHKSPKYAECAKTVAENVESGGQVIFSDYVDAHDRMVDALVAAGIPRKEIGILNAKAASSATKRQNIAEAFNAGKLKVVIGNTAVMGEGINLQHGTTDIHHLDLPWEPASMQQRNGRGLRQGNTSQSVRIHAYLAKGSFDGYRWQSMNAKKDWQDLIWSGGDKVENLAREGQASREDMLIMFSADPEATRAKLLADKSAVEQQLAAADRKDGAEVFIKFQSMKLNLAKLKNTKTQSAAKLKAQVDKLRLALERNKHFYAKKLLDLDVPAIVNPDTGTAFYKGAALEIDHKDGGIGKWVVTDVDVGKGTAQIREYGSTDGKKRNILVSALGDGVKSIPYDEAGERAEIHEKLAAAAKDNLNSLTKWDQVKALPPGVLKDSHDQIQAAMWKGRKDYSFHHVHGKIPLINKATGKAELIESYDRDATGETHDFALPLDEHMAKMRDAWGEAERGKHFGQESYQRRKNSQTEWKNVAKYDGEYGSQQRNPWNSALASMGESTTGYGVEHPEVKKAREQFKREQYDRMKRAKSYKDALAAAIPLATMPDYGVTGQKPTWDKKALAILWARAKHDGILDTKDINELAPKRDVYGSSLPLHNRYLFHPSSISYGASTTLHDQLKDIAHGSGHHDLATAFAVAGSRHRDQPWDKTLKELDQAGKHVDGHYGGALGKYAYPKAVLHAMLASAEKHGVADKPISEVGLSHAYPHFRKDLPEHNSKTVRQVITGLMEHAT